MNRILFLFLAFLCSTVADVLHLSEREFSEIIDGKTNMLVEFYAPWCGHCKNLAPEYKLAGETFQASDDVKLIAIDATEAPKLSSQYEIRGYPTLKWFPKGSTDPEEYTGGRTADTIVKWINEKIGTTRYVKQPPSAVTTLTTANFDSLVLGSKAALVEFYAPWCGHCKQLAPVYEEVAKVFAGDKEVLIGKVDATEESALANKYGVQGYPTIKFFPIGSSEPKEYEGGRQLEDFVSFINSEAGTFRKPDGSLLESFGRINALDEIIAAASSFDEKFLQAIKDTAATLSATVQPAAKLYVSITEKIIAQGSGYIAKELSRIGNIVGGNITPESRTNFQLKQNILKAFSK